MEPILQDPVETTIWRWASEEGINKENVRILLDGMTLAVIPGEDVLDYIMEWYCLDVNEGITPKELGRLLDRLMEMTQNSP